MFSNYRYLNDFLSIDADNTTANNFINGANSFCNSSFTLTNDSNSQPFLNFTGAEYCLPLNMRIGETYSKFMNCTIQFFFNFGGFYSKNCNKENSNLNANGLAIGVAFGCVFFVALSIIGYVTYQAQKEFNPKNKKYSPNNNPDPEQNTKDLELDDDFGTHMDKYSPKASHGKSKPERGKISSQLDKKEKDKKVMPRMT